MRDELSVDVQLVLASGDTKRGHVDGDVKDPKECEREHGRDGVRKRRPVDSREIYANVSQ